MDMKKILQAMDGASTKPVEGASDMKKFVSIIQEGANPHKVTLPVQMAMQHYQQPAPVKKPRPSLVDKYFSQVENEQLQEKAHKRQLVNQYASIIAERVRLKESKLLSELSNEKLGQYKKAAGTQASAADKAGDYEKGNKRFKGIVKATIKQGENDAKKGVAENFDAQAAASKEAEIRRLKAQLKNPNNSFDDHYKITRQIQKLIGMHTDDSVLGKDVAEGVENPMDAVSLDIPLLIRLFEYAREDAKTDMDLHNVAERLIAMSSQGYTLSMDDYEAIVGGDTMSEARKIKPKRKTDPCWSDYKQVGMKKKGGKQVPNCVPKKPQE